jgi:hypothetical protein
VATVAKRPAQHWTQAARERGIQRLVIDPNRHEQSRGGPQQLVSLESFAGKNGEEIFQSLQTKRPSTS